MSLFDALDESLRYGSKSQTVIVHPSNNSQPIYYYGHSSNDVPIFSLDKVQFQFPGIILDLVVSNNILVVALEGIIQGTNSTNANKDAANQQRPQKILRIDLSQAHAVEEIDIPIRQKGDRIRKLFFSPVAKHLLISTESGDNFYIFEKWRKPRMLNKFRGIIVEAVAWGRPRPGPTSEFSTGVMLVGSRQGHIFEAELHATEEFFKRGEERYFKQVYTLHEDNMPITGLRYEKFPATPRKYVVLMTTPDRMYQFIGNAADGEVGIFGELFRHYDLNPNFQEIPGQLGRSEYHCWSPFVDNSGFPSLPKTFAWLTAPGVYYGNFVFGSQGVGDSIIDNAQLLPYQQDETEESSLIVPSSIALTEFHFVMMVRHKVRAVCILNNELVYEEEITLEQGERILKMAVDPAKNTCWIYTNLSLFELVKTDEDRNIWKIYLQRKAFDAAMSYAKNDDQKDKIATAQADYYFNQQRYALSATYYAQSKSVGFEDIALKFLAKAERDALKQFLLGKLQRTPRQDVTQLTLLCTWLVELMLSKLNALRDNVEELSYSVTRQKELSDNQSEVDQELEDLKANLRRAAEEEKFALNEFRQFLITYKDWLDRKTVYSLLSSHDRTQETLFYAELIGDSERIVSHWINVEDWTEGLKALENQPSVDLYYKYSPILIQHVAQDTVTAWIKESNLNSRHLIPALLKYESVPLRSVQNQAIRYLQHVIHNLQNTDPVVHNYLLSLYVLDAKNDDEVGLLYFLRSQREDPHYDVQYALRVCTQHGLTQACIYIYGAMGLYEQAVDWALETDDLELARIYADKPEDDDTLGRRLWLRIARHVIEKKQDIKQAIEFLRQSQLLKIEDILPFFPDFVLIDDFKDEICAALEDYNTHIESLKAEMDEATKSAESIRQDIRELRNRCAIVRVSERCQVCHLSLITRQFYIFPCEHGFHADCLIKLVSSSSGPRQAKRIQDLQIGITREMTSRQSIASAVPSSLKRTANPSADSGSNASTSSKLSNEIKNNIERMKEELDVLVASECALCGEAMIKSIDKPFIGDDEWRTLDSWAV
ncbi:hypothetical protein SeLEV6574_g07674 [Synchytrium endobioticum]|nr:hypothetical protein SeLEV6574_g07674 [Synchytrium endobioticum]